MPLKLQLLHSLPKEACLWHGQRRCSLRDDGEGGEAAALACDVAGFFGGAVAAEVVHVQWSAELDQFADEAVSGTKAGVQAIRQAQRCISWPASGYGISLKLL